MTNTSGSAGRSPTILGTSLVGVLLAIAIAAVYIAPSEQTMGDAQRVMYVHISVAWLALLGFAVMAICGWRYLVTRNLWWDQWAIAIGEVGWMCSTLTLVTGSLWAHAAWGTWWTWDPRLVTSFVLWAIYSGNLTLRSGLEDANTRARLCSVMAIIGLADVPLVVMATRWFRGVHPVSPDMEPAMRYTLVANIAGWTALMIHLVVRRRRLLVLQSQVAELQSLYETSQTQR
ncbi:MAG: cytochrome c biogenesis protein CcsA [Planctomycetales bacterium]|nr:cytochrome c biogenesis protein CcsA [Planctomycetales bacterium]